MKRAKKSRPVLRFVGFCGVDESFAPPSNLKWPLFVEFGLLFREEKKGEKRFPNAEFVELFCASHAGAHIAAHLCSCRLEEVLVEANFDFVGKLVELGVSRFQLNATKANGVDMARVLGAGAEVLLGNIFAVSQAFPKAEFIVQRNEETRVIWEAIEARDESELRSHINVSFLFDASVGMGIQIDSFPRPSTSALKYGYAGGISPENVREVLGGIDIEEEIWIDMESGIRDEHDDFSWEKAWTVCRVVEDMAAKGEIVLKS